MFVYVWEGGIDVRVCLYMLWSGGGRGRDICV